MIIDDNEENGHIDDILAITPFASVMEMVYCVTTYIVTKISVRNAAMTPLVCCS